VKTLAAAYAFALMAALASAPVSAADTDKVLRVAFPVAETGFDPQAVGDIYSNYVNLAIFDTLFRYNHLARPHRLEPNTAAALPEISADGKTWTIRVKPGIYFTDDPAFKGKKRELVAADYVYAWKRILDPKTRSNALQTFEGRIVGAEPVIAKAKETGKFDYDAPMEGLQAIDRYTIRLKLNFPDAELLSNMTTSFLVAVAREVIEAYGDASGWAMANPVGTGPYTLKEWRRGQRIALEANPQFRDERYPDSADPDDRALVAKLKGKKLPIVRRIEISIIEESNPRLLAFEQGDLDYVVVPTDLVDNVLDPGNKLKRRLAERGVTLARGIMPAITYTYFNMEDPIVGGYTPDKIALRRAIGMAYNVPEEIRVIRQGQAIPATQPVPPNVTGYNPQIKDAIRFDPAAARALLDRFGYKDRDGDGVREQPNGQPLVLRRASPPSAIDRPHDELWQRSMAAVGLKIEFVKQKWPDLLKAGRYGQLQMFTLGNFNTTPEGFGFLGLLYGGHAGFSNLARFKLPEYDRLYEQARSMPDGPARATLLQKMSELVNVYAPWNLSVYRYENVIVQPWVVGYKYDPFNAHPWMYYDIDIERRRGAF